MWVIPSNLNAENIPYESSVCPSDRKWKPLRSKAVDPTAFICVFKKNACLSPYQVPHTSKQIKKGIWLERSTQTQFENLWRTPLASCEIKRGTYLYKQKLCEIERKGSQISLTGQVVTYTTSPYVDYLNVRWVECLMGLPIGWANTNIKTMYELFLTHS
jgi:hypothetical protein